MNYKTLIIMLLVVGMIFNSVNAQTLVDSEKLELNKTPPPTISAGLSFNLNVQEESNTSNSSQDNLNSGRTTKISSSSTGYNSIETKDTDKKRIINAFQIKESSAFKQDTITRLLNVESKDNGNFQEITSITLKYVKSDMNKEIFVNEILVMDKRFIEKISSSRGDEEFALQNQISEYINNINKTVKMEIKDAQIENLFNKNYDIKNFIEQIW